MCMPAIDEPHLIWRPGRSSTRSPRNIWGDFSYDRDRRLFLGQTIPLGSSQIEADDRFAEDLLINSELAEDQAYAEILAEIRLFVEERNRFWKQQSPKEVK